jgi:hypothetical protein
MRCSEPAPPVAQIGVVRRLRTSLVMNLRFFLPLLALLMCLPATIHSQQNGDALARLSMMRVVFKGFEEVPNPETKQKEYVFLLSFIDIAIPKQPLVLRRGDKVAGYLIGTFTKREPKQRPNDGVVPGTESTLEIIHVESGEKHVLEPERVYTITRDH